MDKLVVGQIRVTGVGMWWYGLGMGKQACGSSG